MPVPNYKTNPNTATRQKMSEHSHDRSKVTRRADYVPTGPQEAFIVPLLKGAIESHIDEMISHASHTSDKVIRVLDSGCGRQPFRSFFEGSNFKYHSFDVQSHEDTKLDFIGALDSDLPQELLAEPLFDMILCTEVLEHVADWDKAFHNLSRLLSTKGEILLTCPYFYPLHEEPYDFWRPTGHAIRFYAQRHGMRVHDFKALGDSWDVLGTLLARQKLKARQYQLIPRVCAKAARIVRALLLKLLTSRLLQNQVIDTGNLYMSNLAILRKTDS